MSSLTGGQKKDPFLLAGTVALLALLGIFILYPLYSALQASMTSEEGLTLQVYRNVFRQQRNRQAILNSLSLAGLTASAATAVGFLFAYCIYRTTAPGRRFLRGMAILPLISPPFMSALSTILLFGRNGLITARLLGMDTLGIYGLKGLLFVQIISLFPVAYLILAGVVRSGNPDLEGAAMNLGARRFRVFRTVTLPLALPGLMASWLLVFAASLTDFVNPLVIGGGFNVLSVQAYLEFTGMGNLQRGTALAILLLLPSLGIFLLQRKILHRKSYVTVTSQTRRSTDGLVPPQIGKVLLLLCLIISFFILLLYAAIIIGSFVRLWGRDWSLTLDHFIYSYDVGFRTLGNTLLLALISAPVTALGGVFIASLSLQKNLPGKQIPAALSLVIYAVPGTLIGISYVLAFNHGPFKISGTAFILIAALVFRNLPVSVEGSLAALSGLSREIGESAANLGGNSPLVFRKITLPLIKPAFFAGLTYGFIRSMTSVSAIIFLISARWSHISVQILAQTEIMRLGAASVMSFVLIILISLILLLFLRAAGAEKFGGG